MTTPVPPSAAEIEPAPAPPNDGELLQRAGRGDEVALQALFDRWKRPLLGFFHRSLGSHADAEDLTLEVFVRLHRTAPEYAPDAKFTTYLFLIARNLLLNEQRRRRRKPASATEPALLEQHTAETDGSARRVTETEEVFRLALLRLPEKYRTPLLLLQQQQLDYPAAAAALAVTENALRVLVHRGRRRLKAEMENLS
jgi:RNA polymerase sigma-70 factor (ECF subfamily)